MSKSLKTIEITNRIKTKVHNNIINNPSFNIENLFLYETEESNIKDIIAKIPLNIIFVDMPELNHPYRCILFKQNKAWISEDDKKHQRYFTKNKKGKVYSFDLLDILEFYYNKPISQVFNIISDKFKIYLENKWINDHAYKYYQNRDKLIGLKYEDTYKYLKKVVIKYYDLLKIINEIGEKNIRNENFCYKEENIFFFSNEYLMNQSNYKSKSTINKLINLFCFLGLIEKVPKKNIDKFSELGINDKNKLNPITFYIIHNYTDKLLDRANQKAKYLVDNKIKYYNLKTKDYIILAAKFNIPNIVYGENTNPYKTAKYSGNISKEFKNIFEQSGIVPKELLVKKLNCSKKTVDMNWIKLVKKNRLISRRPTNQEKEKYGLSTNQYIAAKKRV